MEDANIKTVVIGDDLCRRAGITAKWISANSLGIYAYKNTKATDRDAQTMFVPCIPKVHQLRLEVILFEPILRKLVNESNGTFLSVQRCKKVTNKNEFRINLFKLSHQYRSIIRACLENLQDEVSKSEGERKEQLSNYITIFYSVECVWHLCEILFVDTLPGDVVLPNLLEWVRFHFPKHERNAANILSGNVLTGAETIPYYWDTVIGVFIQGRIDITRTLLKIHTSSDSLPFKVADNVLRTMPIYTVYGGISVSEFNLRWKHWQLDCQSKIDAKAFETQKYLDLMMRLAVGDNHTWDTDGVERCEAWYELLAGRLMYSEPGVLRAFLGDHAERCIKRWPHPARHLDRTLLALMQQDLLEFIREIQHMSENGWFAAHLIDLLYHCEALSIMDTPRQKISDNVHRSLLLDYGSLLMGHHSLWQVGVGYLAQFPKEGLRRLELLLERLPLGTEARTLRIIQVAQEHGFQELVSTICKQRAVMCLRHGRTGHALGWALRSRDAVLASRLADLFLQIYSTKGTLHSTDLLDSLGSAMLVSDRLIFLGKYCEFHKVYRAGDFKEAASILISLLESKITPKYFWATLLTDALPLLECDDLVLNSNDTYELLNCLEEHAADPALEDKIKIIRMAISRNLARALSQEAMTSLFN